MRVAFRKNRNCAEITMFESDRGPISTGFELQIWDMLDPLLARIYTGWNFLQRSSIASVGVMDPLKRILNRAGYGNW